MARLPGSVQGVVVQMTILSFPSWPGLSRASTSTLSKSWMPGSSPGMTEVFSARSVYPETGNFTHTVSLV